MSTTEPETSSESNSNGKRERENLDASPEADEAGPTTKILKSSDDSDEKESDTLSSEANLTPVPQPDEKTIQENKTEEETPPPAEEDKEEDAPAAAAKAEEPAIQIDRSGQEVQETAAAAASPAAAPAPAATDPRTAAVTGVPGVDPNAQATVINPEQTVEERGEVSALYVGRVIGKGGEMIRDLQARSGARIDVDQNVPAGQPRVITYRGTRDTVDFAKQLVHMLSVRCCEIICIVIYCVCLLCVLLVLMIPCCTNYLHDFTGARCARERFAAWACVARNSGDPRHVGGESDWTRWRNDP